MIYLINFLRYQFNFIPPVFLAAMQIIKEDFHYKSVMISKFINLFQKRNMFNFIILNTKTKIKLFHHKLYIFTIIVCVMGVWINPLETRVFMSIIRSWSTNYYQYRENVSSRSSRNLEEMFPLCCLLVMIL